MLQTLANFGVICLSAVVLSVIAFIIVSFVWSYVDEWLKNRKYKKKTADEAHDYCANDIKRSITGIDAQCDVIRENLHKLREDLNKLLAMKDAVDQANINIMTATSELADAAAATRENTSLIRRLIYRLDNTKKTSKKK